MSHRNFTLWHSSILHLDSSKNISNHSVQLASCRSFRWYTPAECGTRNANSSSALSMRRESMIHHDSMMAPPMPDTYTCMPRAVGSEPHVDKVSEGQALGDSWAAFAHIHCDYITAETGDARRLRHSQDCLQCTVGHSATRLGDIRNGGPLPSVSNTCTERCATC